MRKRPVSCFGRCQFHEVPCSLEFGMTASTSKSRTKLEEHPTTSHDLTSTPWQGRKAQKAMAAMAKGGWMMPSLNLQPRLEGRCLQEDVGRRVRSCHRQDNACVKPSSVDSGASSKSAQLRLQCRGMPSFADTRPLNCAHGIYSSGLLQTPAEPSCTGSFMRQKVGQW